MRNKMIKIKTKIAFETNQLEYFYDAMKERKLTDVVFAVRNRSFFAHMIVLSACSEFFIDNRYKLSSIFSEFEYPIIDAILKFCYVGEISIDDEHFTAFKKLANKLQIKYMCIPQNVKIDEMNCLEVLNFSDDSLTREKAIDLILENFKTLYKTSNYLNLSFSNLIEILKLDKLNCMIEEVFNSVKLWVNSDKENRKCILPELLSYVKLNLLTNEFLVNNVMNFCSPYPECVLILQKVLKSRLKNCQNSIEENIEYEKIVLVGDYNLPEANTIDIYDGKFNSWKLSKDYDFNRSFPTSVLVNDWILIIGGYNGSNKVDSIDLKTGHKYELKPLNQGRHCSIAVEILRESSTDVYVIGGTAHNGKTLSSVERWNSEVKEWDVSVAGLLQAVTWHSASVIDDRIYVTGGIIDGTTSSSNIVQMYSSDSNTWSYCAPMIQERDDHSSITIKGILYVAGGYFQKTSSRLDSVESYDPNANLWTSYSKLPISSYAISLCFYQNKLLCTGGDQSGDVWEYNEVHKYWRAFKSINHKRMYANALVIPYNSII